MKPLYLLLITFALFIDGFQAVIAWAFLAVGTGLEALTPVGGAAAGATAGAAACWSSAGTIIAGVTSAAKCAIAGGIFGAAASALGIPIGIGLGMAINVCISLTMGAGLILLLVMSGMYYQTRVMGNLLVELIPGLDCLPSWTLMVILCIIKKNAEEGALAFSPASSLDIITSTGVKGSVFRGIKNINRQTAALAADSGAVDEEERSEARTDQNKRLQADLKSIDGIRAPSSSLPHAQTI